MPVGLKQDVMIVERSRSISLLGLENEDKEKVDNI